MANVKNPVTIVKGGGEAVIESLSVVENGTYAVPTGVDGYSPVTVNVEDDLIKYMNNTLVRFRTMLNYGQSTLTPGGASSTSSIAKNNIEYWEMPNQTGALTVWGYAHLTKLKRFDAGKTTAITNVSLYNDKALEQLILRKSDGIATLHSTGTIPNAPNLKIYVPPNLIEEYKTATNWTSHADKFRNLYIAETVEEKESMLVDPIIPAESMIICDVDETYTVKES